MLAATRHRFLVLTKRPERMQRYISGVVAPGTAERVAAGLAPRTMAEVVTVAPNIFLGTSVEDQKAADERIPHLLATPAAVRFLSCEPLIGPVDLTRWLRRSCRFERDGVSLDVAHKCPEPYPLLDWVIVGGESGPRARPCDLSWMRSLVEQCKSADVPVFCKQLGSNPVRYDDQFTEEADDDGRLLRAIRESHGRDMSEWPEDLRVREWPRSA